MIHQRTIEDINDPALEPFRDIRNRNWIEQSGWFIAEGPLLVECLLASSYRCRSILLDRKYESQRLGELIKSKRSLQILRVEHELVEQLTGFDFHRGVIGCGLREARVSVEESFTKRPIGNDEVVVFAVGVQDPENLGSLLRNCAGLGVRRVVMGSSTADPFGRRALRVSIATTLSLEICYSNNDCKDLAWFRKHRPETSIFSTCLGKDAIFLEDAKRSGPSVILFGNERNGLPRKVLDQADQALKIRMHAGVDSLNVAVASGIILHQLLTQQIESPNDEPTMED